MNDFFISYTSADQAWANWVAWQLRQAGYGTVHQAWEFRHGHNFVSEISNALDTAERTISLYSPNYFTSDFCNDEMTAAFVSRRLLPVRIRECIIPSLLRPLNFIDLVNRDEDSARALLLEGVQGVGVSASLKPAFPSSATEHKRYPGALPAIFNVPSHRNTAFVGRNQVLSQIHQQLFSKQRGQITAICGLGGVGKTSIAIEYCYRFASDYDLIWWIRAEDSSGMAADFIRLARELRLPESDLPTQENILTAVRSWIAHNSSWLLIFDNAKNPGSISEHLVTSDGGKILITSRFQAWRQIGEPIAVPRLEREESAELLFARTGRNEPDRARMLGELLGDLPLALSQAAGYIDATAMSLADYVDLFTSHHRSMLDELNMQATWQISLSSLVAESATAVDVLYTMAFLNSDDIPRPLLEVIATGNRFVFLKAVEVLRRYSLIEVTDRGLNIHRLLQQVIKNTLNIDEQKLWIEVALEAIEATFPNPMEYDNWPACETLLPHALIVTKLSAELDVAPEATAAVINLCGLFNGEVGRFDQAVELFTASLRIAEKTYGRDNAHVVVHLNNLAAAWAERGDLEQATEILSRGLEITERVYGHLHPAHLSLFTNLGTILLDGGDLDHAISTCKTALEIAEEIFGPNDARVAPLLANLGRALRLSGDPEQATILVRRALTIDEKAFHDKHPNLAIRLNNLGMIFEAKGAVDDAREQFKRSLQILEATYGAEHPYTEAVAGNFQRVEARLVAKSQLA